MAKKKTEGRRQVKEFESFNCPWPKKDRPETEGRRQVKELESFPAQVPPPTGDAEAGGRVDWVFLWAEDEACADWERDRDKGEGQRGRAGMQARLWFVLLPLTLSLPRCPCRAVLTHTRQDEE